MDITCPVSGGNCEPCPWQSIPGQVRDSVDCGLIECQECKLVTHSRSLADQVDYVEGTMHNWSAGHGNNWSKPSADKLRRLKLISELQKEYSKPNPTILDFGCGNGEMLDTLKNSFQIYGLEPDKVAHDLVKSRSESKDTIFSNIEEIISLGMTFDFVTLFHVVEHFYNPDTELTNIHKVLKPNGLILIETPNSQDALLTRYASEKFRKFTYWSHHPMLHSHKSLEALVERNGFSVLENLGTQRYGLANHLYWLSQGKPGGHEAWSGFIGVGTESEYEKDLVSLQMNDTLWLVAMKKI